MRKLILPVGIILFAGILFFSCNKTDLKESSETVSQETLDKIAQLGFSTQNVLKTDEGYLVEGDILLNDEYLNQRPTSPTLRIAEVEQYRTFNLVGNLPRTITVATSGSINSNVSNAVNAAIKRYNDLGLQIQFQRVSKRADITIKIVRYAFYIASSGFPSSSGRPYSQVTFNRQYQNYSAGFLTTVMAHEIGHCIGFRHTDYMDRSYSCGSGGNEGDETTGVGAVHIPGTPTGPDAESWMLACLSATTDRPFNQNDKTALDYLY